MDSTERLPGQPNESAGSRITDPYAVVAESAPAGGESSNLATAPMVRPPADASPSTIADRIMQATEGGNKRPSLASPTDSNAAASSILKRRRVNSNDDARAVSQNDFGSPVDTDARAGSQLTTDDAPARQLARSGTPSIPPIEGIRGQEEVEREGPCHMGLERHEGRHFIIDLLFRERREHNAPILQYFP